MYINIARFWSFVNQELTKIDYSYYYYIKKNQKITKKAKILRPKYKK